MIKVTLQWDIFKEAHFEFPNRERAYEFLGIIFDSMKEPDLKAVISEKEREEK